MIKFFISLFLVASLSSAEEMGTKGGSCILSQDGPVSVSWKAYKTPAKLSVGGTFDSVKYTANAPKGNNFREILVGSSVIIDTASVNSKNNDRNVKLVKFFFEKMSSKNITAKIVDIKSDKRIRGKAKTGVMSVAVTMNGVTKNVPMKYVFNNGDFNAIGSIDLLDFSASKALSSINKACFDLHKGKTWSDVTIGFQTNIKFELCNTK
ncbi:YceI family protein [Sulfurimonas sp.]|uniref:YceI family protein n=1 Tax=Sulfurimonas sp. TaxID=2022749 RepID=UPI002B45BA9F|nr:YceI family protein [Sulfurimonas sp.]